jgi:hypothetical protein
MAAARVAPLLDRRKKSYKPPVPRTGAFDGAEVQEDILAAVVRPDKAEAFLAIGSSLSYACSEAARQRSRFVEIWRKVVQSDAGCAARPSRPAHARLVRCGRCCFERKGVTLYSQER